MLYIENIYFAWTLRLIWIDLAIYELYSAWSHLLIFIVLSGPKKTSERATNHSREGYLFSFFYRHEIYANKNLSQLASSTTRRPGLLVVAVLIYRSYSSWTRLVIFAN